MTEPAEPRTPRARKPAVPVTPLMRTLAVMGARPPSIDDVAAIRALLRGHASPGQQTRAMAYLLQELCGVGSIPFAGENVQGSAFRAGQMAPGIALAQIGDAVLLAFTDHSERIQGDGETQPS